MKDNNKYSIDDLINKSYELYKLNNPNGMDKNDFVLSFKNDKRNKIYFESKRNRKLRIKLCDYQIALFKDFDELVSKGVVSPEGKEEFIKLMNSYYSEFETTEYKVNHLRKVIKIVMLYLITLSSFGLFSYRLNIVNGIYEVFIIAGIVSILSFISFILRNRTYFSYERLIPKLSIIFGLMVGNIYYPVFEYCYIWFFVIIFIDVVFDLVNRLLNKLMR